MLQNRTEMLEDIIPQIDFLDELPEYSTELFVHKKMKTDESTALIALEKMLPKLVNIDEKDFNFDSVHDVVAETIAELEVKNGYVFWPLRVATSGKAFTPGGGVEIAAIIGKTDTISRVETAIAKLKK